MTQLQFEMIIAIIQNGAPALANDLCNSLNNLVIDRNRLEKENEELKAKYQSPAEGDTEENKNNEQ